MNSINWSLLLIIAMVLMVIFVMGAMVIFYLRHWAARYTPPPKVGEGHYFKQYILDDIKTELEVLSDLLLKKKKRSLQRIKYTFTFFIVSFLIITVGAGLYTNRDKLASRIDLSTKEANNLVTTKHDWIHEYPEKIPLLSTELIPLKQHGIVLVVDKTPEAHNAWSRFAKNNQITLISCNWEDIDQCKQTYQDWLFVVLPSYWRRAQLERMFEQGLSVILYDAPTQVTSLNKHSQYSLYGMQFRRFTDNSYSKLALVGDQELSLGFDAGSIIDVNRLSRHYMVHSLYPQAIAIDSANRSGGTLLTRLYAQTVAKGRFVWMDFSPNTGDHAHELEQKKFEGVMA